MKYCTNIYNNTKVDNTLVKIELNQPDDFMSIVREQRQFFFIRTLTDSYIYYANYGYKNCYMKKIN